MDVYLLRLKVSSVYCVYMKSPQKKYGGPIHTRVEERIEEILRKDAIEQERTLSDIMRLILTRDAERRKKKK